MSDESQPMEEMVTAALTSELAALTFHRFAVVVEDGPDSGRRIESDGEELSIGSAQGNTLRLSDRATSRHHCTIRSTPEGFLLRDLRSRNGVKLGGYKVGSAYLKHGATFIVGRSKLRFDNLDDTVAAEVSEASQFGNVLSVSPSMRRVFALLPRVAKTDSTVLIEGETGTGKTLLASAIHDASPRAEGPFVVADCASMTPTLIESQLFGHVRGAYTGATETREGAFVSAHGGTVFLDEIGELPLELQPKLLRVLEERIVTPIGDTASTPIDVRIVAATNRDLREQVNAGDFRADLFYRLHVINVRVPPLRERKSDIAFLAQHFYEAAASEGATMPEAILDGWMRRNWDGNVRELRNAVERLVLLGDLDETSRAAPESPEDVLRLPYRAAKEDLLLQFERRYLTALHAQHSGNITRAAKAARMDRNHLREMFRKHDLVKPSA